ncbi:FAD/NAD(P)-binding domain-containing protein [Parachaetomium inaequale]|uniref:FAD/NAD(P)-binding domain-containing protein n=1 Tax=Parachaetomium inaequale TaxID=2588326 RepID=A0AAN6PIF5_9PEZI|nr:FAD/NAD(P)-binding domain-containing protein [Parachaetomium inaequale]
MSGQQSSETDGEERQRLGNNDLPDYIKLPPSTFPSFHCRIGESVCFPDYRSTNALGFPIPGEQNPSPTSVMAKDYFVTDATWSYILAGGKFDYIVIGSGFTALAFIDRVLENDPKKKILCLERGDFWLPTHFQNLPLPFKMVLGGPSETFPWTLSRKTYEDTRIGFCHGSCPFFGGRSTFWSAWCPQPREELMRGFPKSMIQTTKDPKTKFWERARNLLHVTKMSEIGNHTFGSLQDAIDKVLTKGLEDKKIPSAKVVEPAPLAVGAESPTSQIRFNKFSVPGPLLARYEKQLELTKEGNGMPLQLMLNCVVTGLKKDDDNIVRAIETNRGTISWPEEDTKVVLCAGAIPNATLLLNSFHRCKDTVGKRITGHFVTHIAARCPVSSIPDFKKSETLQLAATYLDGMDEKGRQYHVGTTALQSPRPEYDAVDAGRECPDYAAAATYDQLKGSEDYVVFVCSALGEISEDNKDNFLRRNESEDRSTNIKLQFTLNDDDKKLSKVMDDAIYQTIEVMAGAGPVQYWNPLKKPKPGWVTLKKGVRLDPSAIHVPGIVHEASTAFVGDEKKGGSLDEKYRPHGVENVYVTGGALFPTAGSWNPTLTMCGFAQDLATQLCPPDPKKGNKGKEGKEGQGGQEGQGP